MLQGSGIVAFLPEQNIDFSDRGGIPDDDDHEESLASEYLGSGQQNRGGDTMVVSIFFLAFAADFVALLNASCNGVFLQGVGFSRHCGLIGGYFCGLQHQPIRRDFHSFQNLDNIAHQQLRLMHDLRLSVSETRDLLSFVCHFIQFLKLSLLLVIVSCLNCRRYCHCHQNGESLYP